MENHYRLATPREKENWSIKCSVTLPNTMRCDKQVTRVLNGQYLCERDFQINLQRGTAAGQLYTDLDAPRLDAQGKSEPAGA